MPSRWRIQDRASDTPRLHQRGVRTLRTLLSMGLPADPFVVVISRRDVESCKTSDTLAVLRKWVETSFHPREIQGKLQLWFEGYDSDQRELWMIPEVRMFTSELDEQ